ncbi:MAG: hypothetical protein ACXWP5_08405 [Bdellovibrionota bacterium]
MRQLKWGFLASLVLGTSAIAAPPVSDHDMSVAACVLDVNAARAQIPGKPPVMPEFNNIDSAGHYFLFPAHKRPSGTPTSFYVLNLHSGEYLLLSEDDLRASYNKEAHHAVFQNFKNANPVGTIFVESDPEMDKYNPRHPIFRRPTRPLNSTEAPDMPIDRTGGGTIKSGVIHAGDWQRPETPIRKIADGEVADLIDSLRRRYEELHKYLSLAQQQAAATEIHSRLEDCLNRTVNEPELKAIHTALGNALPFFGARASSPSDKGGGGGLSALPTQ